MSTKYVGLKSILSLVAAGAAALGMLGAANAQSVPKSARAPSTAAASAATVFWSVDKDGRLMLSDRPNGTASQAGAQGGWRTYAVNRDPQGADRAQREREYWRNQADGFSARQRERDRDLEENRRLRMLESRDRADAGGFYGGYYSGYYGAYSRSAGYYASRFNGRRGVNTPAGTALPPVYAAGPGAAAMSGPSVFLSSGFQYAPSGPPAAPAAARVGGSRGFYGVGGRR